MSRNNTHIDKLFSAYTAQEMTEEQFKTLREWINQSPENKQQFSDYLLFYKKASRIGLVQTLDKSKAWNRIIAQLKQPLVQSVKKKKPLRKLYWKYAAAASIVLMVALTIFLNNREDIPQFEEAIIINNQIKTGTDKATLTLADGSNITLEKGRVYQSANVSSNGEEIIYLPVRQTDLSAEQKDLPAGQADQKIAGRDTSYNYLTIPRGGQFLLTLSDGSRVWLNSESHLKYPVTFTEGQPRQVELIYGEAYFDVSPATQHKGSAFKVINNAQEVRVLGTKFNIKAYKDETNIYTTLVEGKVAVNASGYKQTLSPGQQSILDRETLTLAVAVVNPENETSWRTGIFNFKRLPLKDIMKVLSRWYDMEVIFENKALESQRFIGAISKQQSIEEILTAIRNTDIINTYEINNKTVIIK